MKNKDELIKQVIILVVVLVIVIIIAFILNQGKNKKEIINNTQTNIVEENSNTEKENMDEIKNNLKGLLESPTTNEYESSGTNESINTGIKEELRNSNNEIVQYEEIWNGDN